MGSHTNPNTCTRCESAMGATYRYAPGGDAPSVEWSCPVCDSAATPPAPADDLAWLLETADQSHRYLVEGRPGHPAHMTSDPWKATRFKTREAAALKFAMIGTGTLAALGIPNDLRPVEHGFAQPAGKIIRTVEDER